MAQVYQLHHGEVLCLMYFTEVQNSNVIFEKMINELYPFVNCAIINPELILEPFQLLIAANKAVTSKFNNAMITKSLPTELLFNLSISDNITESLNKFGYGSIKDDVLLFAIFGSNSEQEQSIRSSVLGCIKPLSLLREKCNIDSIQKYYELRKEQISSDSVLDHIVTKIACKSL